MFWRNVLCTMLGLALLLAVATPVTAATADPLPRLSSFWDVVWSWLPGTTAAPPQKAGAEIDPDGSEVGFGPDPDGLTSDEGDRNPGIDPDGVAFRGDGSDTGYGLDPNG